jgi:hypothetical protein
MKISRKGAKAQRPKTQRVKAQRKACLIVGLFKIHEAVLLCVFAPFRETQTNITKVKP